MLYFYCISINKIKINCVVLPGGLTERGDVTRTGRSAVSR